MDKQKKEITRMISFNELTDLSTDYFTIIF